MSWLYWNTAAKWSMGLCSVEAPKPLGGNLTGILLLNHQLKRTSWRGKRNTTSNPHPPWKEFQESEEKRILRKVKLNKGIKCTWITLVQLLMQRAYFFSGHPLNLMDSPRYQYYLLWDHIIHFLTGQKSNFHFRMCIRKACHQNLQFHSRHLSR